MDPHGEADRRTSLVTGGTAGLGHAVALRLAAGGDRVLITGRDPGRAQSTLDDLRRLGPDAEHRFIPADLSLLEDTARLVGAVEEATHRLDAVVCCAGVLATVPEYTPEGLERTLVVNYLSRYLLARRLIPHLEAALSGRLVLVANAGRYRDHLDLDDLQYRQGRVGLAVAGRTQFANDLLAVELSERWRGTGVQVTCVYPGVVRTAVFRNARGIGPAARTLAHGVSRLPGSNPERAALTPAHLASDPSAANLGGRFYGPRLREIRIPPRVSRPQRRADLWVASEVLVQDYLEPAVGAR